MPLAFTSYPASRESPASGSAEQNGEALRRRERWGNVCVDSLAGDARAADAAFATAAHVVRLDTWVPRITGVPMEPQAHAVGDGAAIYRHVGVPSRCPPRRAG